MSEEAYARCATLTRDQWAWEFLRRNPDYQADYRRFIGIWQSLEADYGAPPHRDFQRWKRDPRAYGPLPGETELAVARGELCVGETELAVARGELCVGEDDRVLLECWMGAKWGFYKFPLDPGRTTPPAPDELAGRPPPPAQPRALGDTFRLDIAFDLSLPLPPQLEAARFRLVSRAAELRRHGLSAPLTVASQCARWTRMLRVLDAEAAGKTVAETEIALLHEAKSMTHSGYLDILRLADSRQRPQ